MNWKEARGRVDKHFTWDWIWASFGQAHLYGMVGKCACGHAEPGVVIHLITGLALLVDLLFVRQGRVQEGGGENLPIAYLSSFPPLNCLSGVSITVEHLQPRACFILQFSSIGIYHTFSHKKPVETALPCHSHFQHQI